MNRILAQRMLAVVLGGVTLSLPSTAHACAACMGDVNSKTAGAMNGAIFLMIGFIGTMLASFGAFAFYLSRRAGASAPPYTESDPSNCDADDLS